jgi:hypothetical protein
LQHESPWLCKPCRPQHALFCTSCHATRCDQGRYQETKIAIVRAAGGEPDDALLDLYSRVSNTQRRHLEALGWRRVPRDVTPDLGVRPESVQGASAVSGWGGHLRKTSPVSPAQALRSHLRVILGRASLPLAVRSNHLVVRSGAQ